MENNAMNYLLINKDDPSGIITDCEQNTHLWDRIEGKRLMYATSDKCPIVGTYAVSKDILEVLDDPYYSSKIEVVHVLAFMRKYSDINAKVYVAEEV